tara:strand:+ start:248 stop:517 length:270 start_codon:yes stop_codon:yes gene_type:complete
LSEKDLAKEKIRKKRRDKQKVQERVDRWLEEVNEGDKEYETVQVTKHMFVKRKRNDQENIKDIVLKHPYQRWEEITNNPKSSFKDTDNG